MSGKRVIRLGDLTSHGGVVVSASSSFMMFGKEVATMGDKVTCPIKGHGGTVTIVEGDPTWTINGKNIALDGHKCSCGCVLISTLANVTRSYEGMGSGNVAAQSAAVAKRAASLNNEHDFAEGFDQHFLLIDEVTGQRLTSRYYRMEWNGQTVDGYTDSEGLTHRIAADTAVEVRIEIFPEGYGRTAT